MTLNHRERRHRSQRGSVVGLTSVVGAQMVAKGHVSAVVAALITILAGALIGSVNGAAIGGFRMIPFIVTLGMMGIGPRRRQMLAGPMAP